MSPKKALRIDIRDTRLPGGRIACSARTSSPPEFRKREAAIRQLIDLGAWDVLARLSPKHENRLHIAALTLAVQKGDIDSLRLASGGGLMLGVACDKLRRQKKATRRKNTRKQVEVTLKQLERFFGVTRDRKGKIIKDVELGSIGREQCAAFLHGPKNGRVWAPATQDLKLTYSKEVWALAMKDEAEHAERENRRPRLRRNPWDAVEPAKVTPTRVIFLTARERDDMLAKIAGTPLCAFMACAYHAGLRLNETVHLRTGIDVDLDNRLLKIQARPGQFEWAPKTDRGQRDVPINRDLLEILQRHALDGYAGARYFFHTPDHDRPMSPATAHAWWVDAYKAAGIKYGRKDADAVVFHSGRHTFASLLVQQGVSPMIVAELMGDSYEQVLHCYGHLTPHNLRDTVRLLETVTPEMVTA